MLIRPAQNNQNNAGVVHAATEVIDGITYETIYLAGDTDSNQSKVIFSGTGAKNYRYVLMDDWSLVANQVATANVGGNYIILDLNGHRITSASGGSGNHYLAFSPVTRIEFTDSSLTGNGRIDIAAVHSGSIMFSGNGSYNAEINRTASNPMNIIVRGAKNINMANWSKDAKGINWTIAPYMTYTASGSYNFLTPVANYFAVLSHNNGVVTGVYNYEFGGYAWELTVGELWGLAVPADKTYYLWGRSADGWYEYLGIEYRDGAWQNAA